MLEFCLDPAHVYSQAMYTTALEGMLIGGNIETASIGEFGASVFGGQQYKIQRQTKRNYNNF